MEPAIASLTSLILLSSLSMAQTVASGYVEVEGSKIFYEAAGEGPVLIFIHDGLVHREIWDHQFAHFAKDHKAIRYDRRGYGKSSAAGGKHSKIEDLNRLYITLEIEKAVLIGMSSGGGLAIDFTLQYPDKVSGLVLVGSVVGGLPFTSHFYTRGGHSPKEFKTDEEQLRYYAQEDFYEIYRANKEATKKVTQLVKDNPPKEIGSSPPPPGESAYRRLSEIEVPALILVGEFDMPDVHAHAGAINAGIKDSKRDIVTESGHLIPIEQPELFNNALEEFLDKAVQE
jgi:pimeloyl-ACP methyl ester carboxylesterase